VLAAVVYMAREIFRGLRRSQSRVPAIVMLSGLIVTIVLGASVWKLERKSEHLKFDEAADARIAVVTSGFGDAIDALYTVNLVFDASDDVTPEEFDLVQFCGRDH
jgi:CHASE1-domain containing sensor protein